MELRMTENEIVEGITIEDINQLPLVQKLQSKTLAVSHRFLEVQPYGHVFQSSTSKHLNDISNFAGNENDIWISGFPKCGTTWVQEMVWCIKNNLHFEKANSIVIDKHVPYLEMAAIATPLPQPNSIKFAGSYPFPRIIKTHLIFDMLPKQLQDRGVKLIYISRNPRDVCISFYNHFKSCHAHSGTLENFAELFVNDVSGYYTPFIPHVLSYWNQRHLLNVLFITFEDMKQNLLQVIRKVVDFLEEKLSNEDMTKLEHHLSFNNMMKNPAVNKQELFQFMDLYFTESYQTTPSKLEFIMKGEVGEWKQYFSRDLVEKFQGWEDKTLSTSDFKYILE